MHHTWPSQSTGGSELYLAALARRLARTHEVAVLHRSADPSRPDHDVQERSEDGVRIFALNNLHRSAPGFEAYRDAGAAAAFAAVAAALRPDIVHVHHLSGLSTGIVFEAKRLGAAVVFTLHDFATLCPLGQLLTLALEVCPGPTPRRCLQCVGGQVAAPAGRTPARLRRWPLLPALARLASRFGSAAPRRIDARLQEMHEVLRAADSLIAPSAFLRDRMAALGVAGVAVLDYGHEPVALPVRVPDPGGRVRFGFIGVAIPSKGVHVLAEAFTHLDPARASLQIHGPFVPYHGDTDYERRVRSLLGTQAGATLRGPFAPAQLGTILAGIDCLVVPSIWEEISGLVLHEAFLARLPSVVSDHGALAQRVREGEGGLRFRPGDARDLARVLRRLIDEPGLLGSLGQTPPHVPSMDEHARALEGVYREAQQRAATRAGRVGVVVLNHGQPEGSLRAARSARDSPLTPPARVLIVDNGPSDPPLVANGFEVLALPHNRGYAGGMNAGIRHLRAAGCDRLLLLNSDARLEPDCLRRLAEALRDPRLAAVGPMILSEAGRLESRGARFSAGSGRFRLLGAGEAATAREARLPVESLSGAVWLLSAAALDAVGGLEEGYFFGFEDIDWCLRARQAGFEVAVVCSARAHHAGRRSLVLASPDRIYYAVRNHLRMAERMHPRQGAARVLRRAAIVTFNLAFLLRQRAIPRVAGLRALGDGVADFARGRTGRRVASPG